MNMKSNLLKANKISFSHQSNPKSNRGSTHLDNSSFDDPIVDKLTHKRNSQNNKENQLRNIQFRQKSQLKHIQSKQRIQVKKIQSKQRNQLKSMIQIKQRKQSQNKLRKPSQLYINEKFNRLNKISRNQSMYISTNQHQNQIQSSLTLSINHNYLLKNNFNIVPTYQQQNYHRSAKDIHKNQPKSKKILSARQQTFTKIKRTKLLWLVLVSTFYLTHQQLTHYKSKKSSRNKTNQNIPTLFHLVHYLKSYQKKHHPFQQPFLKQQFEYQDQQKVTLTELLRYFKIILSTDESHTVWKQDVQEIDSEKTHLSFNTFGKIIFSYESILQILEREEKQHKVSRENGKNTKQSEKQLEQMRSNPMCRQEDEIVETARFQNHDNLHSYRHENEKERRQKKKNIILTKDDQELRYQEGVGNLINRKLIKKSQQRKQNINLQRGQTIRQSQMATANQQKRAVIKQQLKLSINEQKQLYINQQKELDINLQKGFNKKHSSIARSNNRGSLSSLRDHERQRLKIIQSSSSGEQRSSLSVNRQQSRIQIEDISQILQVGQNQKLFVTSSHQKYNTNKQSIFTDPFHDSLIDQDLIFRNSISRHYSSSNYNPSDRLDSCRLQAINMNSSQLFLQSVILNNLYHTNFNVSFSQQPFDNTQELLTSCQNLTHKQNYSKLQDVVQEIQNILQSIKNLFVFQQHSLNDNKLFFKNINKDSIRLQDLTEMEDFLSQFIDYKVFRKDVHLIKKDDDSKVFINDNDYNKDNKLNNQSEYFNAVKLTQGNLTAPHTLKAAREVVRSSLIQKYLSYFDAIRIYQAPYLVENIEMLIGNSWNIKILNLGDNELNTVDGLIKVIQNNMNCLQFLNLSHNRITSLQSFFHLLQDEKEDKRFGELIQLHVKNNRIAELNYKTHKSRQSQKHRTDIYDFPKLQLLDLRSNMIDNQQMHSIQRIILESPRLSIMSIKQNPIMETPQSNHLEILLSQKSIYEYHSLQMMSTYIKYKDITFTHSNEGCCSLIDLQSNTQKVQTQTQQNENNQLSSEL